MWNTMHTPNVWLLIEYFQSVHILRAHKQWKGMIWKQKKVFQLNGIISLLGVFSFYFFKSKPVKKQPRTLTAKVANLNKPILFLFLPHSPFKCAFSFFFVFLDERFCLESTRICPPPSPSKLLCHFSNLAKSIQKYGKYQNFDFPPLQHLTFCFSAIDAEVMAVSKQSLKIVIKMALLFFNQLCCQADIFSLWTKLCSLNT